MSPTIFRGASFDVAQNQRFSDSPSKLVIAIDLATTRVCLATGQRLLNKDHNHTPPVVKLYTCWRDCYQGSRWPITAMLYNSKDRPVTGNDLEIVFRKGSQSPSPRSGIDLNKHFRQWKLLFHDDQSDPAIKKIQDDLFLKLASLGKTRLDLLRDWVKLIYKVLLIPEEDGLYSLKESIGRFDKEDIEIVVTVPPGRSVLAHDQVHEAFIQGPIGKGQVFLVSEPEAMFRSWVHDQADPQDFKVGGRYMVVDGGGGTCCIVRFRLDRLEPSIGFEQEYESESLVCGAESISNLVEEKIASKIAQDYPNRAWVLDQFRRQFDELYKSRFGAEEDDNDIYNFTLPNLECELSRQEIAECFDMCIGKLFRAMDRHLSRGLPVHFLVLGGGLFASPYVELAVKKRFNKLIICELSADKGHVARGGVLVRSCASFITIAPIFRSKAVTTFVKVTDAMRNSPIFNDLYTQEDDGGELWYHAAQWLTKQGTETKIKYGIEKHEVASETSFKGARKRYFKLCEEDLSFSETVLTFNHTPPANEELIFQLRDGTWLSLDGQPLPRPTSEKLTWNPKKIGVDLNTLEISCDNRRILRYAIHIEMREVGTKYLVKTWSWTKPYKTKGRVRQILFSEPDDREALFATQEISRNLAVSYDLGPGMRKETTNEVGESAKLGRQSGLTHQHQGTVVPVAAKSMSTQLSHVASSLPNVPATTVQPRMGPSQAHQSTARRSVSAAPSSHTQELLSAQWDLSLDPQSSHSPFRIARPTQRQSIEGNPAYSRGAPRNNGGCWTCSFRNRKCDIAAPECSECASLGLICEYGRPAWWDDDRRRQEQKEINKRLTKEHREMLIVRKQSLERARLAGLLKPVAGSSDVSRPIAKTKVSAPLVRAQFSSASTSPVVDPQTLVRRKAFVPKVKTFQPRNPVGDDEYEIYDATPPPHKRVRILDPNFGDEASEDTHSERRRSKRQREPAIQGTDMVMWKDIDGEEFDMSLETSESD